MSIALSLASSAVWGKGQEDANALPDCTNTSPIDSLCWQSIDQLHPTQSSVGMAQVAQEVKQIKQWQADKPHKLTRQQIKKAIPVVIDQVGAFYLTDRHHWTRALSEAGVTRTVVRVIGHSEWNAQQAEFWTQMTDKGQAWLFDAQGIPLAAHDVPPQIQNLSDNPYRSVAGWLQDEGLIDKPAGAAGYFFEMRWAVWLAQYDQGRLFRYSSSSANNGASETLNHAELASIYAGQRIQFSVCHAPDALRASLSNTAHKQCVS